MMASPKAMLPHAKCGPRRSGASVRVPRIFMTVGLPPLTEPSERTKENERIHAIAIFAYPLRNVANSSTSSTRSKHTVKSKQRSTN